MNTSDNITALDDGQIFVFGSNLNGNHAGGAAKLARERFGAQEGVGEGLTGECYAFPTLDVHMGKRLFASLEESRDNLFATAREFPEKTFLLTKVGCGIAGFSEELIAQLFVDAPKNIIQPNWNI